MIQFLESIETEKCRLKVYEYACGFHIGVDATYLEQVGDLDLDCPNCKSRIYAEGDQP